MLTLGAAVVVLAAVCVWQWRRYRKTVKKVVFLFDALDNGDYTFRFPENGKYDDDKLMNASLNRVKEILRHARDEQIEREKYFELIIDSVDTGILVLDDERGVVLRCNKAALKLLQTEVVTHVNQIKDRLESLSVRDAYTTLKGRRVRIVAISDIKGELANQEIDSWVKLIRVLTHEIMNTITPIVSLSEVMLTQAEGGRKAELEVINRTSKEQLFYVKPFLERMARLAEQRMRPGCTVGVDVSPEDLLVYADEGLIGRVVSNLLKNAVEAVGGDGSVSVRAYTGDDDKVVVDVTDDGEPIPDDVAAHVFVPFFTTKKDGSGVGLSISRQIMRVSNGTIQLVQDRRNKLTTFRLTFN